MTAVSDFPADPLLPWLRLIKNELINRKSTGVSQQLYQLASDCTRAFKNDVRYQNDLRFLKVWFIHMDGSSDIKTIFEEMQQCKICVQSEMLYEWYASMLELRGMLRDAHSVYQLGISRNAEPVERLKTGLTLFYERMSEIVNKIDSSVMSKNGEICVNPWSTSTITNLLQKIKAELSKYKGYYSYAKEYPGKVALSTLAKSVRNGVIIDIGSKKYQIIGCAGQGGFAQVFKARVNSNPEDVVALKIQKPAFPWEFYMYRQLDLRILGKERSSFGFVHRLDLYSDYSILVSAFLSHGTLQDAINFYAVKGGCMAEVLCIYYTIELLSMLEALHGSRIVHGDFKPDNLLIRYARDDLTEDNFIDRTGPWEDQGLCLVDWGRGIDPSLFPDKTKFTGDCCTSGFRCIEMQENKLWTFQVDIYGLCVIVHMMLHNSYMETEKKMSSDGSYIYLPKAPFKRYWKTDLWKNLVSKLLNTSPDEDHIELLRSLRKSFQDYMCSKPQLIKDLKQSLVKQRQSMISA